MEHGINSIHKRALKLVYQYSYDIKFQELLIKDKSVSVHRKNLQLLATEIFKSKTGVSPELMNDIFHFVERHYNLRSDYTLERKRDHTVYHGSESLSSLVPKLWDLLPNSIKNSAHKEFCTFRFVMLLLDHLHIIFFSCTSFSDIFSRNPATYILFNNQRFSILYIHVYIF